MTLIEEYRKKRVSAEVAVKAVNSGDWVEMGFGANMPRILEAALAERKEELFDVKVRGGLLLAPLKMLELDPEGEHFTWFSYHLSGIERKYAQSGKAFYIPIKYSELPRYLRENLQTDVAMFQSAPMDEHGYFNFGVTISHFAAAISKARTVIIEINEDMPRVHGGYDHTIHLSQVDYVVEGGHMGMPIVPESEPSSVDRQIAEYLLPEIADGSCIQLGIGGMPLALGKMIAESDLKDLGVHSEMIADAYVDMYEAGVVNNKRKQWDLGRMVYTLAMGTQKLYDFLHDNTAIAAYPVDYTNDPWIASQNDKLISINSALEVDLSGQVCSETVGPDIFSGSGGQLDFVEAAYRSKGGKSFICLPSTYKDKLGQIQSRIKPLMTNGAVITDTRTTVQYVVTEYGKVNLKGLSTWQRAEQIISLAHPKFREDLISEAEKLKIWRQSSKR